MLAQVGWQTNAAAQDDSQLLQDVAAATTKGSHEPIDLALLREGAQRFVLFPLKELAAMRNRSFKS